MAKLELKSLHKAIIYLVISALFFAFMNMFVQLSGDVPTIQKTFFRNFFALIVASVVLMKKKQSPIPPKGARLDVLLRSVVGYIGVICNFFALSRLNISDASLLNKMSPFFAIIFSIFLLKEKANRVQWAIILTAFIGVLFVIKPTFHNAELLPSLVGFLGGLCAGCAYTFVRRATKHGANGSSIVFCFSAFSCIVSLPFVIFGYSPMTLQQFLMLVGAGLSAAVGQFCITAAYSHAPAKEVSIYDYSQILFSAAIGFFVMGQLPDMLSVVGYVIIIAAAYAMFRYNNRRVE
ncbi:MAG: DMT family transporter [Oscillospiraceae bacterium]|nr:DMT family transporter [Oscillospiraceae bacterium]